MHSSPPRTSPLLSPTTRQLPVSSSGLRSPVLPRSAPPPQDISIFQDYILLFSAALLTAHIIFYQTENQICKYAKASDCKYHPIVHLSQTRKNSLLGGQLDFRQQKQMQLTRQQFVGLLLTELMFAQCILNCKRTWMSPIN